MNRLKLSLASNYEKALIILIIFIICSALAFYLISLLNPWSEFNCQHQDINIKNGKVRFSRYLFNMKISEEIKDTTLSLALEGEQVDFKLSDSEWRHVNTFSLGVQNSPHYNFHGATAQIEQFKLLISSLNLCPREQKEIARNMLKLWQEAGSDSKTDEYINSLPKQKKN